MSNPMEILRCAEIRLSVRLPGSFKVREIPIVLGEEFAEALHPLPGDREVPWMPLARKQANEMERMRAIITDRVAIRLANELARLFTSNDPTNGYSPEEWAKINPQPTEQPPKSGG